MLSLAKGKPMLSLLLHGHELAGLYIPYTCTTPYLQMRNQQPNASMRDFMTTLSKVPICALVEPVFDQKYVLNRSRLSFPV